MKCTVEQALNHPKFSHTRRKFYGKIAVYVKDDTSPSGVMLLCGFDPKHYDTERFRLHAEGKVKSYGTPHPEHAGNL